MCIGPTKRIHQHDAMAATHDSYHAQQHAAEAHCATAARVIDICVRSVCQRNSAGCR